MNKKAALEMSVQSIVIFVITFIVVGLLIGLITSMFQNIEDNLGVIETPPTVNPTASKPIAVAGDKLVLRTNREATVVFGVYLSESIAAGDTLSVNILSRDTTAGTWDYWKGGPLIGLCTGFDTKVAQILFASNFGVAPTDLGAGQTMGITAQVKPSSGTPTGTYTCFMNVESDVAGSDPLAFGSFELEIKS